MVRNSLYWVKWIFTKTVPAGRLFGVPLSVHLLTIVIAPLLAFPFYQALAPAAGMLGGLAFGGLFLAVLYGSIVAHEFGHVWGKRLVGGEAEGILLTPIGGIAYGLGAEQSPKAELIVVALGPAVSVLLAGIGFALQWAMPNWQTLNWYFWLWAFVYLVASVNLMLAIFNLVFWVFPLDGSRLIRAGFSLKFDPHRTTELVCKFGIGLAIVVLIAALLGVSVPYFGRVGMWLAFIAIIGIQGCLMEKERIRQMPVYTRMDVWGTWTVFYDTDLVGEAKTRAAGDLRNVFKRKAGPASPAPKRMKRRPKGPATVIDVSDDVRKRPGEQAMSDAIDLEKIDDLQTLADMMRRAADEENFKLAARIQKRIRDVKAGQSANWT